MTNPGTLELTQTTPQRTPGEDSVSHLFCKDQTKARMTNPAGPATSRCGKHKAGWVSATGLDLACLVCNEYARTQHCAHCNQ